MPVRWLYQNVADEVDSRWCRLLCCDHFDRAHEVSENLQSLIFIYAPAFPQAAISMGS